MNKKEILANLRVIAESFTQQSKLAMPIEAMKLVEWRATIEETIKIIKEIEIEKQV